MGRAPQTDDLIVPREDGKQRLVSGTYKQFKQDLETLGLAIQRQYESRSTFRNLALSARASEFHVNLITHPKPKRASDYYTRLEMQWPGMCEAVLDRSGGLGRSERRCSSGRGYGGGYGQGYGRRDRQRKAPGSSGGNRGRTGAGKGI